MTPRLFSLAVYAVLIAAAGSVRTMGVTSPSNGEWDTMVVTGGFGGARRAVSVRGPLEDWRTIPLLIELSYRGVEGLRVTRDLEAHFAALRGLRTHGRAVSPEGVITLAMADSRRPQFERLLDTLGLEFDDKRHVRFKMDAAAERRVEVLAGAGLPMHDIVERLNSGGRVSLETSDAVAPLPLGAAFWERRFTPVPPPDDLLWAILASREMSSLYYGLLGLDGPTLRAIAADPKLEAALVKHALVLPTIAPTLRIDEGRVRTPGAPDATPLWQDLVGKSADRPAEFIGSLLGRDEGRLAYFYASVAALPKPSAQWVLSGTAAAGQIGGGALRRSYDAFKAALGEWRPDALIPAPRQTPADVLLALTIDERGTFVGPAWTDFWRRAVDSDDWPKDAVREIGTLDEGRIVGAADILEVVCATACDPARLGAVVLLQREFPDASVSDAPRLLLAARARLRYPALALELERMKLADLDVYRQLGGLAARIDGMERSVEAVTLVQFQAAVAMLARVRALGAPSEWVKRQIQALAELPVSGAGFDGGLVRWLDSSFLASASGAEPHDAALHVLSGKEWQKPGATFEWEGLRYRVDVAARERERIREAHERFSGNTLNAAIGLVRLADEIPEAVESGDLSGFEAALSAIADRLDDLRSVAWTGEPSEVESFQGLAKEATDALRRARPQDRDRMQRAARTLFHAADLVAADAAVALVYACALQDPQSPFAMSRELPRRHRLRMEPASVQRWTPWSLPVERHPTGGARHIAGALLALDAGVPQLFIRRINTQRPDEESNLGVTIANALWRTAALSAPWTVSDEDLGSIDDARTRGVEIVEGWPRQFDERLLDRAGIAGPRAGWLRWGGQRAVLEADILRLEDLVRLGSEKQTPDSRWGAGRDVSNCLCPGIPRVPAEMRGPAADIEAAVLTLVEPSLRVAQELRARGAPAALASGVLMLFTTELIDQGVVPFPIDEQAVVGLVRQVPSARFDDYVAAVAARGPLVPIEEVDR